MFTDEQGKELPRFAYWKGDLLINSGVLQSKLSDCCKPRMFRNGNRIQFLLVCNFCCVAIACLFLLRRSLLLNVSDDIASIHVTHVDVGHPHVVFFQERRCNRVLFFEQLVGVLNDLRQPLPAADVDYAQQIWPDFVSMSDGMARDTIPSEQILAFIEVLHRASVSRTHLLGRVIVLEIIEKITNHPGLKTGIIQGGTTYPLADCLIA